LFDSALDSASDSFDSYDCSNVQIIFNFVAMIICFIVRLIIMIQSAI
jgi:hypothetical protein